MRKSCSAVCVYSTGLVSYKCNYRSVFSYVEEEIFSFLCCVFNNRCRGFKVGIPQLDQLAVFDSFPWDQPTVFSISTEMGFFKTPPAVYKQIQTSEKTSKMKKRYQLRLSGTQDGAPHQTVLMTAFSLCEQPSKEKVVNEFAGLARDWFLHLYQVPGFENLRCKK